MILTNIYYASANSEIENGKCSNEYFSNMSPSFSIIVRNDKPILNPGDSPEFKLYINGYGASPNFTKISVYLPIRFVDNNSIIGNVSTVSENILDTQKVNLITTPLKYSTEYTDFHIPIPNFYFNYSLTNTCHIKAETNIGGYPPVTINITTAKNLAPGDHKIDLILSYSEGEKSYSSIQEAKYHINSWWEQSTTILWFSLRNQDWLFYIILPIFLFVIGFIFRNRKRIVEFFKPNFLGEY